MPRDQEISLKHLALYADVVDMESSGSQPPGLVLPPPVAHPVAPALPMEAAVVNIAVPMEADPTGSVTGGERGTNGRPMVLGPWRVAAAVAVLVGFAAICVQIQALTRGDRWSDELMWVAGLTAVLAAWCLMVWMWCAVENFRRVAEHADDSAISSRAAVSSWLVPVFLVAAGLVIVAVLVTHAESMDDESVPVVPLVAAVLAMLAAIPPVRRPLEHMDHMNRSLGQSSRVGRRTWLASSMAALGLVVLLAVRAILVAGTEDSFAALAPVWNDVWVVAVVIVVPWAVVSGLVWRAMVSTERSLDLAGQVGHDAVFVGPTPSMAAPTPAALPPMPVAPMPVAPMPVAPLPPAAVPGEQAPNMPLPTNTPEVADAGRVPYLPPVSIVAPSPLPGDVVTAPTPVTVASPATVAVPGAKANVPPPAAAPGRRGGSRAPRIVGGGGQLRVAAVTLLVVVGVVSVIAAAVMFMAWLEAGDGRLPVQQRSRAWDLLNVLQSVTAIAAGLALLMVVAWTFVSVLNVRRLSGRRRNPVVAALAWPVAVIGVWAVADRVIVPRFDGGRLLADASVDWLIAGFVGEAVVLALPLLVLQRSAVAIGARRTPFRVTYIFVVLLVIHTHVLGGLSTIDQSLDISRYGQLTGYLALAALLEFIVAMAFAHASASLDRALSREIEQRDLLVARTSGRPAPTAPTPIVVPR